jgi:hypothetical protein
VIHNAKIVWACASLFAIGASSVALGQSNKSNEIIVTGQSQTTEQIREEAKLFVKAASAMPVAGQFARWRVPICPKTSGIAESNAAIVNAKIRLVAEEAGIRVAKANCKPNLVIIFTDNAAGIIAELSTKKNRAFGGMGFRERELLTTSGGIARWWYATGVEGIDGHQSTAVPAALMTASLGGSVADGASASSAMVSNGQTTGIDGYSSSLIGTRVRAKIERATFIVDANKADGRTLKSVAAYAALVTLARIKMDHAISDPNTILGRFADPKAPAEDLTARDKAFLSALYEVPPNRDARQQTQQIVVAMSKILASGN